MPGDPLYAYGVCSKEDQSGEEEVPCDKVQDVDSKQININPTFFMNIEVDTPLARDAMVRFIKDADFIKKLANSNEIDIEKFKREVAGFEQQRSFELNFNAYNGREPVDTKVKNIRNKIIGEELDEVAEDDYEDSNNSANNKIVSSGNGSADSSQDNAQPKKYRRRNSRASSKSNRYYTVEFMDTHNPHSKFNTQLYNTMYSLGDQLNQNFSRQRYLKDDKVSDSEQQQKQVDSSQSQISDQGSSKSGDLQNKAEKLI